MPAAETLEQCAGPEARKLFEKFTKDLQKLQALQNQDAGHTESGEIAVRLPRSGQ